MLFPVDRYPTATAGALAEAAKDDREEVAIATPQEAMEALTRIEIQFSMLRDRRYCERMEEICRESEMVLEGEIVGCWIATPCFFS